MFPLACYAACHFLEQTCALVVEEIWSRVGNLVGCQENVSGRDIAIIVVGDVEDDGI